MFKVLGKVDSKGDVYSKCYSYIDRRDLKDAVEGDFFNDNSDEILGHNVVAIGYGEYHATPRAPEDKFAGDADELDRIIIDNFRDRGDVVKLISKSGFDDGEDMLVFGDMADTMAEHETDDVYELAQAIGVKDLDMKISEIEHKWIEDAIEDYAREDVANALDEEGDGNRELTDEEETEMYDWIADHCTYKSNRVDFSTADLIKHMQEFALENSANDGDGVEPNEDDFGDEPIDNEKLLKEV